MSPVWFVSQGFLAARDHATGLTVCQPEFHPDADPSRHSTLFAPAQEPVGTTQTQPGGRERGFRRILLGYYSVAFFFSRKLVSRRAAVALHLLNALIFPTCRFCGKCLAKKCPLPNVYNALPTGEISSMGTCFLRVVERRWPRPSPGLTQLSCASYLKLGSTAELSWV